MFRLGASTKKQRLRLRESKGFDSLLLTLTLISVWGSRSLRLLWLAGPKDLVDALLPSRTSL
jgi:hypothetical protein